MLQFALNISLTLRELALREQIETAARLGFSTIELWWPRGEDHQALVRHVRDAGLQVALLNFDAGVIAQGERGMLNHPQRQQEFRANVPVALDLAQQLGCRRLNALVGKWLPDLPRPAQLARVRENLAFACEHAAVVGTNVLVESLNHWENAGYLVCDTANTIALLQSVGAPNLRYQYDVYHMQRMEGNIVPTIMANLHWIDHIQVADTPGRHQPGTGELNYPFIFAALAKSGYAGFIGLEFIPRGSLEASLAWLPADRRGPITPTALAW
ncbi:MAG: hydroxypyruvate isomerase family protein [Oscillochloridaceae bacterium umkhey_bin13]